MLGPISRRRRRALRYERDSDLFETFVVEHWDYAHRVAYLVTCDRLAAEDIAQDAILKALRGRDGFDDSRPIRPWLGRIAANSARDWLRKQRRSVEDLVEEPPGDGASEDGAVAAVAAAAVDGDLLAALHQLDPARRAVVVMRYMLEMETEEIAEILEIAPATVRTRSHRALEQLRSELATSREEHG